MIDLFLLTNQRDFSLDRVIHWLSYNRPDIRVQRVNREELLTLGGMSALLERSGWKVTDGAPKVAWLRQFLPERDPYAPPPSPVDIDDIIVNRHQWLTWMRLLGDVNTRWINGPTRTNNAECKVLQLSVATRVGFPVPRTLLTNSRHKAKAFVAKIGPSVVKSISAAFWEFSDQSFVFTVDAERAFKSDTVSWNAQPVFVQEHIYGKYEARLFVIGKEVVAAYRPRTTLDWRTDPDVDWAQWAPDQLTVERALHFIQQFDLDFGAFDLLLGARTHSEPVFLECNPSGDFGFLDDILYRQPSEMIARLLTRLVTEMP